MKKIQIKFPPDEDISRIVPLPNTRHALRHARILFIFMGGVAVLAAFLFWIFL